MNAGRGETGRKAVPDILAGIETGIVGGLVMLVWFALSMPLVAQPWWLVPNILASRLTVYHAPLLSPGIVTIVGAAVQLAFAGFGGIVNGILTPGGRLFGLGVAACWYALGYVFVWKRAAPALLIHAPQPIIAIGYFLYGSVLGWHPHLLARLRS